MEKFSGTITNTPPPLPKDGIYTMQVRIGTPIEGVKVTDGNKVVFSDKDGYYEITTDLQGLTFSKEGYESRGINLYPNTGVRSNKKDVYLQKSNATTNQTNDDKKTITSQKSSLHKFLMWSVGGLVVIIAGVAIYKFAKKGK